jgi:hypothetical protein
MESILTNDSPMLKSSVKEVLMAAKEGKSDTNRLNIAVEVQSPEGLQSGA